jgi:hypothetical protein
MLDWWWGSPWIEKRAARPTATISQQAMVDAWTIANRRRITIEQSAAVRT